MKSNFYETLLVPQDADDQLLRHAYHQTLAALTRKLRAAQEREEDVAGLEMERLAAEEAWSVLSDPARRRRYDRFLELAESAPPHETEDLWSLVAASMVDPAAQATLELVRILTDLPVEEPDPRQKGAARVRLVVLQEPTRKPEGGAEVRPIPEGRAAPARVEVRPEPAVVVRPPPAAEVVEAGWFNEGGSYNTTPLGALPADDVALEVEEEAPVSGEPARPREMDSAVLATLVFNHGYSGELIQKVRLARGISLEQVAESTRISVKYLEAIEADDYAHLPATTFVRGYLKEIARMLGLDAESLMGGYLARLHRARG